MTVQVAEETVLAGDLHTGDTVTIDDGCVSVINVEDVELSTGPRIVKVHVLQQQHPYTTSYTVSAMFAFRVTNRTS